MMLSNMKNLRDDVYHQSKKYICTIL